ncbi:MAG: universal stress protein, partial [Halanaeroarchaeum sp.]
TLGIDVLSETDDRESEQGATEAIESVTSTAADYGVESIVSTVERGEPADVIIEYVETNDIDAVVMGTTGRRGTERILLGSVAEKTVPSAPVPVLTVGQPR